MNVALIIRKTCHNMNAWRLENMDDNLLNRIYGKPINVHVREDHGETETLQKELMQKENKETVFKSEAEEMGRR